MIIITNIVVEYKFHKQKSMEDKNHEKSPWRRAWGVTEFAQLYFPGQTPVVAYKRMWEWIRVSRGLKDKLEAAGWVKFQKLYTPKQVSVLIDHLGEP